MDIGKCQNCNLYRNQPPLLDTPREADIMWVGLSAKKVPEGGIPLSRDTASGKLIREIEASSGVTGYKTNLVNYPVPKGTGACQGPRNPIVQ